MHSRRASLSGKTGNLAHSAPDLAAVRPALGAVILDGTADADCVTTLRLIGMRNAHEAAVEVGLALEHGLRFVGTSTQRAPEQPSARTS